MKLTLFRGTRELSALYADGKLDKYGEHEKVYERAAELAGVEVQWSDDFLRGGSTDAAPTVAEITAYQADRAERAARAAELRRQASELNAQATALLNGQKL
jgi:hypothetical protein